MNEGLGWGCIGNKPGPIGVNLVVTAELQLAVSLLGNPGVGVSG